MMAGTSTSIPSTMTDEYLLELVKNPIESLLQKLDQLNTSFSQDTLSNEERSEVRCNIAATTFCLDQLMKIRVNLSACDAVRCPFKERPNINEKTGEEIIYLPQDKGRYLCISDGLTICCLDLKECIDEPIHNSFGVRKVPSNICALKSLAEGSLVSLGLSTVGSHAYNVGRHGFSGSEDSDLKSFSFSHLSLVDGHFRRSQCSNIRPPNKPETKKVWPIVEKIDDQIHVIECLRSTDCFGISSHVALSRSCVWKEFSSMRFPWSEVRGLDISNHIVVGHRFYAGHRSRPCEYVVFDSKINKWEKRENFRDCSGMITIKHVTEILQLGFGRCVGEYVHGDSGDPPLYVVLAVGFQECRGKIPIAYLVTGKGQVLCFQQLYRLFEGFEELYYESDGTVISFGGEQGKSMCAIIVRGYGNDSLHIATFTWEVVHDALSIVSAVKEQIRDDEDDVDDLPFTDEEDFLTVLSVNGWYVSQVGDVLFPQRASACFL